MSFFLTFTPFFSTIIMRSSYVLLMYVACCGMLSSCFKDEPLNAECDIEEVYVHTDNPSDFFFAASDTLVNVPSDLSDITFNVKVGADLSNMAPIFKVTDGATMEPANGSPHDFSDGRKVTYKVTSQDGQWNRTYTVAFKVENSVGKYDFENFRTVKGSAGGEFYEWSDLSNDGKWLGNWATGNPGFNLSMSSASADSYPTAPLAEGYYGAGVKLETCSTGELGSWVNMAIAAGNLFIGYFDVSKALTNTLKATNFGRPFDQKPIKFKGWYKYSPGKNFQDRMGNIIPDKVDQADIYAVFYRNHDSNGNPVMLYGDDVLTNSNIVAIARLDEVKPAEEWTMFDIDFNYTDDIDENELKNRGYNLAVVFTSSREGASFCGAIGSTLYIDEVEVVCEKTTE